MHAPVTLQPHICGACESPIAPYRSVVDGRQCKCPEPCSPSPVPDDSLCFFVRDAAAPEPTEVAPLAPALDSVESMRLAMGATPTELAGELINEAREKLLGAMKIADRHRETDPYASDLHRRTCELVSETDDHLSWVAERSAR